MLVLNLNSQVTLCNKQILCPSLATVLMNAYCEDVPLFIDNHCIYSSEGTIHKGALWLMAMCSISFTTVINDLWGSRVSQVWFADDVTAGDEWWSRLQTSESSYGCFMDAS